MRNTRTSSTSVFESRNWILLAFFCAIGSVMLTRGYVSLYPERMPDSSTAAYLSANGRAFLALAVSAGIHLLGLLLFLRIAGSRFGKWPIHFSSGVMFATLMTFGTSAIFGEPLLASGWAFKFVFFVVWMTFANALIARLFSHSSTSATPSVK